MFLRSTYVLVIRTSRALSTTAHDHKFYISGPDQGLVQSATLPCIIFIQRTHSETINNLETTKVYYQVPLLVQSVKSSPGIVTTVLFDYSILSYLNIGFWTSLGPDWRRNVFAWLHDHTIVLRVSHCIEILHPISVFISASQSYCYAQTERVS